MVALFNHCTFNLNPRAASIDTPLHGFVPHPHVDHVHADAVIAIAACDNAEALTERSVRRHDRASCRGSGRASTSASSSGAMASEHPEYVGVVLGGHGLFTWGPTSKACLSDHDAHHPTGRRLARGTREAACLRRSPP